MCAGEGVAGVAPHVREALKSAGERAWRSLSPMACAKARCLGCRKWFTPDRRTATRQKRCTRKCGTRHRRAQAKARRYADLETYRASERERQRAGRERRREGVASAGAPEKVEPSALSGAMSRAEWSAQVLAITM